MVDVTVNRYHGGSEHRVVGNQEDESRLRQGVRFHQYVVDEAPAPDAQPAEIFVLRCLYRLILHWSEVLRFKMESSHCPSPGQRPRVLPAASTQRG